MEQLKFNELIKDAEEIGKLINGYEKFIKNDKYSKE